MPTAKKGGTKAGAKPKPAAKKGGQGRKKIETPANLTFVDDKRAQYARLVAINHGKQHNLIPKATDVNAVTKAQLEKCLKDLTGGNLLDGNDGIDLIQKLSKAGATDDNVAKRGLTRAYAQEVRPFLRRKQVSESFGRRGKKAEPKEEKPAEEEKEAA
jgi:hypothetical protein